MVKLDLVIVTFNRIDKLKKALSCYEHQTCSFRNLILVDNCSTDGTKEYVDDWAKKDSSFNKVIIHSKDNVGGAGGFYLGQEKAMGLGADWVFVADDDAYAEPDMIEKFYQFIEKHDVSKFSAVCTSVQNLDGAICYSHRRYYSIVNNDFVEKQSMPDNYNKSFFEINLLSYVGSFLKGEALRKVGLVNPRYFIYFDDTEHSLRLKRYGSIICVPSIKICHEEGSISDSKHFKGQLTWRFYYECRNKQRMLFQHYPHVAIINTLKFAKYYLYNRKKGDAWVSMGKDAFIDAIIGRMGRHSIYKPGWKVL